MTNTQDEIDRIHRDIESCRRAMNDPRVGGITMRKLYSTYGFLLRELDRLETLEIDLAIDHVSGEPDEKELSSRATVYRNG